MSEKQNQESMLFRGQVKAFAGAIRPVGGKIDVHVLVRQRRTRCPIVASGQRADAGEKLLEDERLAEIVVGPAVQPPDSIRDSVSGGKEQHGRRVAGLPVSA
jgi:hypothetical protein